MPASIEVRADIVAMRRRTAQVMHRQIPFATKQAVNAVAFDIMRGVISLWLRSMKIRRPAFPKWAIKVIKARDKRLIRARVWDSKDKQAIGRQVEGEIVRPMTSPLLKVPTWGLRTTKGNLRRALGNTFVGDPFNKGRLGVWERPKAKKRLGELNLLYNLEHSVDVAQHWPASVVAFQIARFNFQRHFRLESRKAVKTARI